LRDLLIQHKRLGHFFQDLLRNPGHVAVGADIGDLHWQVIGDQTQALFVEM